MDFSKFDIFVVFFVDLMLYFMLGPIWLACLVALQFAILTTGFFFYKKGRADEEVVGDAKGNKKMETAREQSINVVLATRGINYRYPPPSCSACNGDHK